MASAPRKSRDSDLRVVRTRAALRAAMLALTERTAFAEITVTAIAEEAGIGYATFFRHYPDKQALLADIADGFIQTLIVELMPLMLVNDTAAAARALTRFIDRHLAICQALLFGAGDEIRRDVTALAIRGAAAATIPVEPSWLPRELAIVHTVGATLTILAWWLQHGRELDAETVARIIDRLVMAPTHTTLVE